MSPDNRQEISIVFSDLGYSYLLRGDFPKSERALNNALAYNENSRIAVRNLALLHGYRGDFEKAYQTFASVGGEAEARAELDRLFPHWQDNAQADPTMQPTPSLAANDVQPAMNSSTFPTSVTPASRRFPEPTLRMAQPITSSQSSQHLAFNAEPAVDPNAPIGSEQSAPAERITTNSTAAGQPLQAPPPQQNLADTTPRDDSAPPAQPPAYQLDAYPARHVTQAAYSDDEPRYLPQQPASATNHQNKSRTAPRVAIQIDEIQPEPNMHASRTALALGGAIGLGGMFPTSQIEPQQSLSAASYPTMPDTNSRSTGQIQQMSAQMASPKQFTHDTQHEFPTNTALLDTPPVNVPPRMLQSPNPPLGRTELIPSPNAAYYDTIPLGVHRQPAKSPGTLVPNPNYQPQNLHSYPQGQ